MISIFKGENFMNTILTRINAGASSPFRLLHITDTHLTLADERNDQRKIDLAKGRSVHFPYAESILIEASQMSKKGNMPIVHTGDLIDFVSEANLDRAKEFIDSNDVFFIAGNHEFSLYVGEAFEDKAYRDQSLAHVQESFKDDIRFNVRKINGVKLIGIDNSYYRFEKEQLDALKREIEEDLPIILLMHNPLHEPELYEEIMKTNTCAYLTTTPEELMQGYPKDRYIQQKPDDVTIETTRCIESCPLIRAIITGHLHRDFDGMVAERIPQYVTGIGTARIITIE